MADVSIRELTKSFGDTTVVDRFSLDLSDGDLAVLLGPSGSGKTTTLRLLAGLEAPDCGDIDIGGRSLNGVSPSKRNVAMVFQDFALYPHLSAFDNIAFPLRSSRLPKSEILQRVQDAAERLNISSLLKRKPNQLSAGQQQRLAVARAVVRDSDLLLMDEPMSNVDVRLRDLLRQEMRLLHEQLALTTLFVTHDQSEAMQLGRRIVVMNNGKIEQIGTPREIYREPANRFVAEFIGSPAMNFLDRGLIGDSDPVLVGVRPECVLLEQPTSPAVRLQATVTHSQFMGPCCYIEMRVGTGSLLAIGPPDTDVHVSSERSLYIRHSDIHRFDADTGNRINR